MKQQPKIEVPEQEYRIEVIRTGADYITKEEGYRRCYGNMGHYDARKTESVEFSIKSGSQEAKLAFNLLKAMREQQDKIARLESKIKDFNAAHQNLKIGE